MVLVVLAASAAAMMMLVAHVHITETEWRAASDDSGRTAGVKHYIRRPDDDGNLTFTPVNNKYIKTLPNVCIVKKPNGKMIKIEAGNWASEKDIVVYRAKSNKRTTFKVLGKRTVFTTWTVNFTTKNIPSDFNIVSYPAYFVSPYQTGNLYHFIHDLTVGVFGVMNDTNRLNSYEPNQVLFQRPLSGRYDNPYRYKEILRALSVREDYHVFHGILSGTCYPFGVFGVKTVSRKEIALYLTKQFEEIYPTKCNNEFVVNLLQRKTRQILNAKELLAALKQNGYTNSNIITFENTDFEHQWRTIRCTNILIGVQGAGLQWAMFLRPASGMLELIYEKWPVRYGPEYKDFDLSVGVLKASETHYDWDYISKQYLNGKPLTDEMKKTALNHKTFRKIHPDLWSLDGFKWANAAYDAEAFVEQVKKLHKAMNKQD